MRRETHHSRRAHLVSVIRVRIVASTALLVLCAPLLFATGCGTGETTTSGGPEKKKAVAVELVRVEPEFVKDVVSLSGELQAENNGTVKAEISGVINEIAFEEGQTVATGDVLFKLKNREQRALLLEAQAEERLAKDVFDRQQRLASKDVASLARKAEASAELDKARARVALARLQLDRTTVTAPFDGVVGVRMVAPGDQVDHEDALVQILAMDRLQAIFTVTEIGVPLAKVGLPVAVQVAAWPEERFPGKVFFVSPSLDSDARRLILKAWIANDDHRLKPGMFVNVDVEIDRKDDALMVPETAIVYDRNGTYVWRAGEESKAQKVPIELGLRQQGRVEIVSGIEPGDQVVAAGTHKVMADSVLEDPRDDDRDESARDTLAKPRATEAQKAGGES